MVMEKNSKKKSLDDFNHRFGTLAIEMGFVTIEQVLGAIFEQVMDNHYRKWQKKIGSLMIDKGLMTNKQVEEVLKKLNYIHEEAIPIDTR
jgi:hypothetical protein